MRTISIGIYQELLVVESLCRIPIHCALPARARRLLSLAGMGWRDGWMVGRNGRMGDATIWMDTYDALRRTSQAGLYVVYMGLHVGT